MESADGKIGRVRYRGKAAPSAYAKCSTRIIRVGFLMQSSEAI